MIINAITMLGIRRQVIFGSLIHPDDRVYVVQEIASAFIIHEWIFAIPEWFHKDNKYIFSKLNELADQKRSLQKLLH
jgi:hypothetical protein